MSYDEGWCSYQDWRANDSGDEPFEAYIVYRADLDFEASRAERPFSLILSLAFRTAEPDGLYNEDEFEVLEDLDAALLAAFDGAGVLYVGRVTGGAKRFYCCYAEDDSRVGAVRAAIDAVEAKFAGYSVSIDAHKDGDWELYRCSLEPEADDAAE